MEKLLLTFLDIFSWAFRLIKVDYEQLRAIVATKLLMDNRRQLVSYMRKRKTESTHTFELTLVLYVGFGAFVSLALYAIPSFILSMIVFFTYIIVMIAMTLVTDFSSILLDSSDNTIILPRPVDGRTLFVARVVHIQLYLCQLAAGLSLLPSVSILIQHGLLLFAIFWIAVGLSILIAVFLTNTFYLLIMQFASAEKLKSIINYFQIFMAVAFMGAYQILPRVMERMDLASFVFEIRWWSFLLPPVWMAGVMEAFEYDLWNVAHIALAVCAVTLPILGIYLVTEFLTPVFNKKLAALEGSVEQKKKPTAKNNNQSFNLSRWITTSSAERGTFDAIYKILGRDRKIKLKIYPAFGYVAIFGLIFMMRSKDDFATTWANLPNTQYHLVLLYIMFMVLQVAINEIPYSDDFKASWIYYSTPLESPGEIFSGMLKAICVRLFVPGYVIITILVLSIWGLHAIADVVVGMLNNFLMLMILVMINKRHLPLSMAPNIRAQSGNLIHSILSYILIGVLGLIHFLLTLQPVVLLAAIPVQLSALYIIWRAYKKTRWEQVTL